MSTDFRGITDEFLDGVPGDRGGRGDSDSAPSRGGMDRTPPQDNEAEQAVLGSMLLSKDAIADVLELVKGADFYRPAHEFIFDAILDLYGRGEPADAITVSAELSRTGLLQRAGGPLYLHDLVASVAVAANASYYAQIVREKGILRRLVEASLKIAQMGYAGEGDVTDIVDRAQAAVYSVTDGNTSEDYQPLSELLEATLDEMEAISSRSGDMAGVPTGFIELDELTNGLHGGQMVILAARPAVGKALALDTPLPTSTGWTTMGEVAVGDELLDARGEPTRVVAVTEVLADRECFRITFDDDSSIVADGDHRWPIPQGDEVIIHSTAELAHSGVDQIGSPPAVFGVRRVEPVESVPVRCVEVDSPDHLYLAGESKVPTHNSTLGLDFARACSIKNGMTSAIFSLEMSKLEITMRLLSAEAQIPLNHIRKGTMNEEDWQRVANKMATISSAPLFIDDSPNLTMMEIRAKARRLKQKHDLKLIVIDYLQLMTSGKKVESRQLEVSEFSRQIKLLAKELHVPVVAMSQLNRGPEQRTDKKPMVSDLRESGCLTPDTRILRADTGAEITIGELYRSGERDIPVWSVDEHHRLVPMTMTHAFSSGVKEVFRMKLASGREIKATANHPFLTLGGWQPLGDLTVGSRLATPRQIADPLGGQRRNDHEVALLAHLIGDGSFVKRQPIRYASIDEDNLRVVGDAASELFGITPIRDEYAAARVTTLRLPAPFHLTHDRRNPIAAWLDGMGLFGLRSHEKFIPEWVFGLPLDQVQDFIGHLWATDGSVRLSGERQAAIYYATTSRRLIDDLARLLLRCGIVGRVSTVKQPGYRDSYHLHVSGAEQQLAFCRTIAVNGARGVVAEQLVSVLETVATNTNVDTVPREVWDTVRAGLRDRGMTHREFAAALGTQFCGSAQWKHAPSRARMANVASILENPALDDLATSDLHWDTVVSVESIGEQEVFDATVPGTHNFIADGIVVHNSLEQDADIVILLHREDIYDKESPRLGEADFIVAKNRNGPTRTLVTAFQGHYSRFVDMQH